jgi:uncharacterized protein (DUF1800 family)
MRHTILTAGATLLALLTPQLARAGDDPVARDLALVNRLTWGANAAEMRRITAMGSENWLQAQLHPAAGDHLPATVQAAIDQLPALQRSPLDLAQDMADRIAAARAAQSSPDPAAPPMPTPQDVRNTALVDVSRQDQTRLILRDLYSTDQLREQMTAFWLNHFSVFGNKEDIRLFLPDYENHAIRPNALGHFRVLLEATLRSPAMLHYLDNAQNSAGHLNENYAREIMELHTLGVGAGYTQGDVQELARILTGVATVTPKAAAKDAQHLPPDSIRDGMFAFYPARHDRGDKLFLGHVIHGSGYDEVQQALDILCAQPATARHISRQLAQYFVADTPPPALVERMAERFLATHGDVAKVLDLLFHSPEFRASLAQPLLKDPQHYVLSALRMAYEDRVIVNTAPVSNWLSRLAQPPYGHLTPDGYPQERGAWNGPGQIEQRFEIAQAIGSFSAGLFKGEAPGATARPAFPVLQGALYYGTLANRLTAPTRAGLEQATSPQEWNIFFLASPDFMGR